MALRTMRLRLSKKLPGYKYRTRDSDCTKFTEKAGTDLESIDGIDWLELLGYYWHIGKLLSNCIQVRMN